MMIPPPGICCGRDNDTERGLGQACLNTANGWCIRFSETSRQPTSQQDLHVLVHHCMIAESICMCKIWLVVRCRLSLRWPVSRKTWRMHSTMRRVIDLCKDVQVRASFASTTGGIKSTSHVATCRESPVRHQGPLSPKGCNADLSKLASSNPQRPQRPQLLQHY